MIIMGFILTMIGIGLSYLVLKDLGLKPEERLPYIIVVFGIGFFTGLLYITLLI